jgi:Domain of unknown function (DUF4266)
MKQLSIKCLGALALTALSACSGMPQVQAWEKGTLAKPAMRLDGNALEGRFAEHIYASKENSAGGTGVGGGGCGCN